MNSFCFQANSYRISTITATGSINTEIDLDRFFDYINVLIEDNGVGKTDQHCLGLVYAEFGKKKTTSYYEEVSKKFKLKKRKENTSKRFDNQLTIIYKFNDVTIMNIKVFKNGNIQITGIKSIDDGSKMIDVLIDQIKQNKDIIVSNIQDMKTMNYKVALINSDFKVDFEIKRDKLHSVIVNNYDNKCSFEPCIYPGVKIQYFWNTQNKSKDGICKCREDCFIGKGDGVGEGNCKKITIAVFQSGCVIITGAQTIEQIDDAYLYICTVFHKHYDTIKKNSIPVNKPVSSSVEPKKKIILKKSSIIYPTGFITK